LAHCLTSPLLVVQAVGSFALRMTCSCNVEPDVVAGGLVGCCAEVAAHQEEWADGVLPEAQLGKEFSCELEYPDAWPGLVLGPVR
jgi:hypothetical protein